MANPVYELVGREVPAFVLRKPDGSEQTSSMLGSEPPLLVFLWGSRDPDHSDVLAAMDAVHREHASRGLVVVGAFAADDPEGQERELRAAEGAASFPVLFSSRQTPRRGSAASGDFGCASPRL